MENVDQNAYIISDGHFGYRQLPRHGYKHSFVNHAVTYVDKIDPNINTQTIEGFWGQMKRGITGVYRHVSQKYLQSYINEYAFRYNHRHNPDEMFRILLERIV